jgi:hypothetical protein
VSKQKDLVWLGLYDNDCAAGGGLNPNNGGSVCCDCIPDPQGSEKCLCFGCVEESKQFSYTTSATQSSYPAYETKYDTTSCQTGLFYSPYNVKGEVGFSRDNIINQCQREVLGFTQTIRRCHPNGTPSITDPLSAAGLAVVNGTIYWALCEKVVSVTGNGYVTLQELVSALSNNLKGGISFSVNEPNLWLADRLIVDPILGYTTEAGDVLSRVVVIEELNYQRTEFWFRPASTSFRVLANVSVTNIYCAPDPYQCNPICECSVSYKKGNGGGAMYEYWSEAYYFYEHPNADKPSLYPSVFVPDYNTSPYGDYGRSYAPPNVISSLCGQLDFPPQGEVTNRYTPALCTEYELVPPCNGWIDTTTTMTCTPSITKIQFV